MNNVNVLELAEIGFCIAFISLGFSIYGLFVALRVRKRAGKP